MPNRQKALKIIILAFSLPGVAHAGICSWVLSALSSKVAQVEGGANRTPIQSFDNSKAVNVELYVEGYFIMLFYSGSLPTEDVQLRARSNGVQFIENPNTGVVIVLSRQGKIHTHLFLREFVPSPGLILGGTRHEKGKRHNSITFENLPGLAVEDENVILIDK